MRNLIKFVLCLPYLVFLCPGIAYTQSSPSSITYLSNVTEGINAPLRMAEDGTGNIYVTDAFKKSISKYDAFGNFLGSINAVALPISVAVNPEGVLFIGDGKTGHIFRYDEAAGATLFYTGTQYPNSMEFSPENVLYVSDSKRQEVVVLDLSGNLIRTIGSGTLDFPTGIALDNNNKRIIIGEHGGAGTGFSPVVKVYMFDMQGKLIKSFGKHGNTDGRFYRVQGLTIGKCGNIYVVDPYLGRVSIFDENGVFRTKFGEWGKNPGQLNIPMDIIFDAQERLMVSSMNNGALALYNITDTLPSSNIKSGNKMICSGETTDIEIAFTGTSPWTFTYTIDGTDSTLITTSDNPHILNVSESGFYEVTKLSDANFTGTCFTGSAAVTVNTTTPTAEMTGDATICGGDTADVSIAFTGSAPWTFAYTTDGKNPTTLTTVNNPHILKITDAGHFEVTALDGGGCTGTAFRGSATIAVNPRPTATILNEDKYMEIEPKETVDIIIELTGTPPWSLTYTNGLDSVTIGNITNNTYALSVSEVGSYEIAEVSDIYCSNTKSQESWDIVLKPGIVLPTSYMNNEESNVCPEETTPISIGFTGTGPWTFTYEVDTLMTTTIFNTYTNPYIINTSYAGTYKVIALSDVYYEGEDFAGSNLVSMSPLPEPQFSFIANSLNVIFTNHSLNANSYFWDFGDGNTSTETNPVNNYEKSGEYITTLTASNGVCSEITTTDTISVLLTSIETVDLENQIKVYPNPTSGLVTIEVNKPNQSDISFEIININGQKIYSNNFYAQNIVEKVDLNAYSNGMYLVKIFSKEFIDVKKLILNK